MSSVESSPKEILVGDKPIQSSKEDELGLASFADALAVSLIEMSPKAGLVVSIEGGWGTGKTSAIRLAEQRVILRALAKENNVPLPEIESLQESEVIENWTSLKLTREIHLLRFNPWNFSGQENLTKAFFDELALVIGFSPDSKLAKAIKGVANHLPTASTIVGAGLAALVGPAAIGVGAAAGKTLAEGIQKTLAPSESLESAKANLSSALRESNKRIIVIIDDLDRLLPSEMRAMFSLVKSLGDLPNILYVLSFDRDAVSSALKSSTEPIDPEFLEKIIQVPLKLPPPWEHEVRQLFFKRLNGIIQNYEPSDMRRWRQVFREAVAPYVKTPRDVARFSNTLQVLWPNVRGDVDLTDLVALTALQLFEPKIYDLIFSNIEVLSGDSYSWKDDKDFAKEFLPKDAHNNEAARRSLAHLFPRLAKGWNDHIYDGAYYIRKKEQRRLCTKEYYRNYFLFGRDPDRISKQEIEFALKADAPLGEIRNLIERVKGHKSRSGASRVATFLEQVVETVFSQPLLSEGVAVAILDLSDELIRREDRVWELFASDNLDKLDSILIYGLEPLSQELRNKIVERVAVHSNGLTLAATAVDRLAGYAGLFGGEAKHESEQYISAEVAKRAAEAITKRLRQAAKNGDLISSANIGRLMWIWSRFSSADEVKRWLDDELTSDETVVSLAGRLPNISFQSDGETTKELKAIGVGSFKGMLDLEEFRKRLESIAHKDERAKKAYESFCAAIEAGKKFK